MSKKQMTWVGMCSLILVCLVGCTNPFGNAPPNYAKGDTLVEHETFELASNAMGENRRMAVYLPPEYAANPSQRFPVLFMPDGGVKEDFPHLTHTVDGLIRAGKMQPIIVVGVENTQRRRDMTGPTDVAEDKKIAPVTGGSEQFRQFFGDELKPYVAKQYRTTGQTAVIGESAAGLFIVEAFFRTPDLFDTYIAIDPSLWWNNNQWGREAPKRLKDGQWQGKTLYVNAAGFEGKGNIKEVAVLGKALAEHAPDDLVWYHEPRLDLEHSAIYRSSKEAILVKLFPPSTAL